MTTMSLPRVLIFGQPFNKRHGGGITLTNLFKGWDKDKIAVAATGHVMYGITTDVCDTYYQLGNNEFKWRFPFNYIQRNFPSGLIHFNIKGNNQNVPAKNGLRYYLVNRFFYPALEWSGLFHCVSRITLSASFKKWLFEYKPDILYLQVSSLDTIRFAQDLCDFLKIPSVIHMMDDWPSTISTSGPLKKYWRRKIDREFRLLLNKVRLHLSISDAMSEEYKKRYGIIFKAFHNPVDITQFNIRPKFQKTPDQSFRILYIGRIGTANKLTISKFAAQISKYRSDSLQVEFDIYSHEFDSPVLKLIKDLPKVNIKPAIDHERIPALLARYDLLLLPLDFTEDGLRFARFSIPTKASEYMLSGTPVLVYAPEETAVSKFFNENDCGYCLTSQDQEDVQKAIWFLIEDTDYREKIRSNAINLAKEKFDAEKVRKEFQSLLMELSIKQI